MYVYLRLIWPQDTCKLQFIGYRDIIIIIADWGGQTLFVKDLLRIYFSFEGVHVYQSAVLFLISKLY